MNALFELKIRELNALGKEFYLENQENHSKLFEVSIDKTGKKLIFLGCEKCYLVIPKATKEGYSLPNGDTLVNLYSFKNEKDYNIPKELALNIWLCPYCKKVFNDLIPEYII